MQRFTDKLGLWFWGARQVARLGRPDVAIAFLGGLGDELLCSAPLAEWRDRGARNVWLMTTAPALFTGHERGVRILPNDPRYPHLCGRLGRRFRYLSYSAYDAALDRDPPPEGHLIAAICRNAGLTGTIRLRPYWTVSPAESAAASPWRDCVAIQTSTLTAHVPMLNKQWPVDRFQAVVDRFSPRVKFAQIGSAGDPALCGVEDLRGRTSLRETAALLHAARGFVGLVGFLMHVARAVECPAAIVYGGRETPALTGYSCNVNVANAPVCAPCWQRARCDFDRRCMTEISTEQVCAAVETLLARPRGPLAVETVEL